MRCPDKGPSAERSRVSNTTRKQKKRKNEHHKTSKQEREGEERTKTRPAALRGQSEQREESRRCL